MNPFAPPEPQKLLCDNCKAEIEEADKPGWVAHAGAMFFLLVICGLAAHGLVTIAKQYGYITPSGEHFWFEEQLRNWIWGLTS